MTTTLQCIDRDTWQRVASGFLDYNYRQLWDFSVACADRLKAVSEHVVIYDRDKRIGLTDVRIKKIPFLNTGIAYINWGPLIRNNAGEQKEAEYLKHVLIQLIETYVRQRKLVLRIQPILGPAGWNALQNRVFEELRCTVVRQHKMYRTLILDLSRPLEDIRKQLNQKWRNCLNNAEKRGLTVKIGNDEPFFSVFLDLYKELSSRKDFDVDLHPDFYLQVQKKLPEQERFSVTIIYENEQPVAGHVSSVLGDTCVYLLGATSDAGLKNKSAYLAQWSVIQMAKEHGCQFYDLGGIDPEKNPGVYHFKSGLSGVDMTAPGPYEYYPDGLSHFVVGSCEKCYKLMRRVRKS